MAEQTSTNAELSVSDLANLKSIIDVSVKRGTFNASEISAVGNVYDKLNNFLTSIAAQQQQQQQTNSETQQQG